MLIRAGDTSVYNLTHIERLEIVEVSHLDGEMAQDEEPEPTYVLRAYIHGQGHDLVGPTLDRGEVEAALNRIFNMVSDHADLHRPSPMRSGNG